MEKLDILKKWIAESNSIVFFGGAGVSTESGIKDFRSADGLYSENWRPNEHSSTEYVSQSTVATRLNPGFDPGYVCSINVDLFYQGTPEAEDWRYSIWLW